MRGVWGALVALAVGLTIVPGAAGHGSVNAKELEVKVLADELSDVQTSLAGYDLGDFYVAERYEEDHGDGLYFHTLLYGEFPGTPAGAEFKVVFRVTTVDGAGVSRFLATTDGQKFTTDFTSLDLKVGSGGVEVERAFLAYNGTEIGAGSSIQTFVVESLVDGELRDRAPGGIFVPGSQGMGEVPDGDSEQVVERLELVGPVMYMDVNMANVHANGRYAFNVLSRLTKGDQHVHLQTPAWADRPTAESGWVFEHPKNNGGEVKAKANATIEFGLRAVGDAQGLVPPIVLSFVTDIGGRNGIQVRSNGDSVSWVPENNADDWTSQQFVGASGGGEAPGVGFELVALAAVAAGLGLRRGRRL